MLYDMIFYFFFFFFFFYVSMFICVWVPVVPSNLSPSLSSTAFIPPLLLLPLLLRGALLMCWKTEDTPQKEGISCAYWSCWKWLKGDLCWERRDCYHCIWFITLRRCGGGPVAAVRKSRIPGAPSTHQIAARMETEAHPATYTCDYTNTQTHAHNPPPSIISVWRAQLHTVQIFLPEQTIIFCSNLLNHFHTTMCYSFIRTWFKFLFYCLAGETVRVVPFSFALPVDGILACRWHYSICLCIMIVAITTHVNYVSRLTKTFFL